MLTAPGVPNGGDVIDIEPETEAAGHVVILLTDETLRAILERYAIPLKFITQAAPTD
jgi:hypothetical protein